MNRLVDRQPAPAFQDNGPAMLQEVPLRREFVLLAMERTGSNMLVSALNSHPAIRCHGELLRPNARPGKGALKVLPEIDAVFMEEDYRRDHPASYLRAVFALDPDVAHIGFKLMLGHSPPLRDALIANPEVAAVLLYRANALAAYSSHKIARVTGQGAVGRRGEVKTAKVPFKARQFENYVARREQQYDVTRALLAAAGRPYLDIEYLEISDPNGMARVVAFLGADPSVPLDVRTQKRNSNNILERFSNDREVEDYLLERGLEHWAHEDVTAVLERIVP